MMSATGATRGEEERGLIEQWLAARVSRYRLMAVRLATFGIVAATSLAVTGLVQQVGPFFKWPEAVMNLSVFTLYGTPLVSDVYWRGLWAMLGITLAGFIVAFVGMQRRDVGR
jgi:putative exporter of polyketide antibiotics